MLNYLQLSDLKIGMKVKTYQLDNIRDACVCLLDVKDELDKDTITALAGTVVYFGQEGTPEFYNTFKKHPQGKVMVVKNIPDYIE